MRDGSIYGGMLDSEETRRGYAASIGVGRFDKADSEYLPRTPGFRVTKSERAVEVPSVLTVAQWLEIVERTD